jgi:hypothetical protein
VYRHTKQACNVSNGAAWGVDGHWFPHLSTVAKAQQRVVLSSELSLLYQHFLVLRSPVPKGQVQVRQNLFRGAHIDRPVDSSSARRRCQRTSCSGGRRGQGRCQHHIVYGTPDRSPVTDICIVVFLFSFSTSLPWCFLFAVAGGWLEISKVAMSMLNRIAVQFATARAATKQQTIVVRHRILVHTFTGSV